MEVISNSTGSLKNPKEAKEQTWGTNENPTKEAAGPSPQEELPKRDKHMIT